ncbi:hypothetical protein GR212_14630 [Rhizobium lusitanum]|uniref:Uncharacterized protein n=1 Tax=Rhizobium lusitanum TaxID=293958 RepID=A0A6L9U9N3_9HYPH|nr:hypothetical protein [Rhizobium lusitanum]
MKRYKSVLMADGEMRDVSVDIRRSSSYLGHRVRLYLNTENRSNLGPERVFAWICHFEQVRAFPL